MKKMRLAYLVPLTLFCCHKEAAQLRVQMQVMQWPIGDSRSGPEYYQPGALMKDQARMAIRAWPEPQLYLAIFHIQKDQVQRLWPEDATSEVRGRESPTEWPSPPWPPSTIFTGGPDFVLAIASRTPLSEDYAKRAGLPYQTALLKDGKLWQKLRTDPACNFSTFNSTRSVQREEDLTGSRHPNDPKGGNTPPQGGQKPWVELRNDVATFIQASQASSEPVRLCVPLTLDQRNGGQGS